MSNSNLTSYNFHNSDIRVVQNDKGEVLFAWLMYVHHLTCHNPIRQLIRSKRSLEVRN